MLTELGVEALKSDLSARNQPAKRSLVVQPNFQALLMEPYMPALYWLARFATLEQVGRVSRFTLTREALQRVCYNLRQIEASRDYLKQIELHDKVLRLLRTATTDLECL
jgi:hypothetical protein